VRKLKLWIALAVAILPALVSLAIFIFLENRDAPYFEQCVSYHAAQYAKRNAKQGDKSIPELRIQGVCTARFLDKHNGSVAAAAGLAVAVFTLILWQSSRAQIKEIREQIDLARQEFESEHRPWISINKVKIRSGIAYDDDGTGRLDIALHLENVGNTPAVHVEIAHEIVLVFGDPLPRHKEISEQMRSRPPQRIDIGFTLFPGKRRTVYAKLAIFPAAIEAFNRKFATDYLRPYNGETVIFPTLIVCVDYCFTFAPGHHQTSQIQDLRRISLEGGHIGFAVFDVKDGPIPKESLWLTPPMFGVSPD
jgi:hypothetical protein